MANALIKHTNSLHDLLDKTRMMEGIAPLLLRLYLAPIMIQAGYNKLSHFEDTAAWFGNPDWGLGLPMPEVMAAMAAGTEFFWRNSAYCWLCCSLDLYTTDDHNDCCCGDSAFGKRLACDC